ncbi:hypothetical protein F4679DRAFT_344516 [Xylaria curta]|nr:hypothetical protein F4679DRAFT_344516 [Xylaria curta]
MSLIDPLNEFDANPPARPLPSSLPKRSSLACESCEPALIANIKLLRSLSHFANSARQMPSPEENEGQEIFDWARRCEELFQKLLSTLVSRGGIGTHYRTLRDYSQRFGLWAGFIGVFADGSASLDHRLRFYPEVQDLILRMLKLLERNLSHGWCLES